MPEAAKVRGGEGFCFTKTPTHTHSKHKKEKGKIGRKLKRQLGRGL